MKKFICILISVLMLCTLPVLASAEQTGSCGENVSYSLDAEGNLTLTGTGATCDYGDSSGIFKSMNVKTLTVSEGITSIGKNMFRAMPELKSVTLPSSLKKTDFCSFYNCPKLESVDLGEGIEVIGTYSFSTCPSIKEIILPDSVKFIAEYAFQGCTSAEKVTFGSNVRNIEKYAFFRCLKIKELSLPDSLVHIDNLAFSNLKSLEKVTFGKNLEYIGKRAFENDEKLTEITLPPSLRTLLTMAFASCSGLQTVNFPDFITEFEADVFADTPYGNIKPDGFKFAGKMITGYYKSEVPENLIIPEGTLGITDSALSGMTGIKSVTLPEGILNLGNGCFKNCTALSGINFPESIQNIQADALYNTKFLNSLPDGEVYINNILYVYKGTMPEDYTLTVKEGTESISGEAFLRQKTLEEVILPASLKCINKFAFYGCTSLENVNAPSSGLEYLYWQAFSECPVLGSFTVPSTVKLIDRYVFFNSAGLQRIYFDLDQYNCRVPTYIDTYAFSKCPALKNFTFPYSTEELNFLLFNKTMSSITILNPELVPDENKMGIDKNTVITGFKGSEAEKFAESFGCEFTDFEETHTHSYGEYKTVKEPTVTEDGLMESRCECGKVQTKIIPKLILAGDTDIDGKITASDARITLRASVALETLTEEQKTRADLDGDKNITASDARLILRKSVGL